ncbi:MAG: hypothetical protein A2579_04740 [Lysobacterales bacterium RIFOXYD1_FULL_69_11]|nr:MAG: hypothetical protein A2190_03375 [Xanthomonadales bacterium RIFOXYA1_FULL_69_10]OHE87093.1 MAG: hypothetical protein A2579_04740 [Xanthomonadales bacterium RIFOXYD1_FULL_69_11]
MKTLRVLALAMLAGGAVTACSMHGPTADPAEVADRSVDPDDGTWCGTPGATGPVYINITYAANGAARASPENCYVDSGTEVTWRGPMGEPVTFRIEFKAAAPLAGDLGGPLESSMTGRRDKVRRVISGPDGNYAYGIAANGVVTDPAIIIRRQL